MADGRHAARPAWRWLRLLLAAVAVAVGVGLLVDAPFELAKPDDMSRVARCDRDFADGCLTERPGTVGVWRRATGKGSLVFGDRDLAVVVTADVPRHDSRGRVRVQIPRQDGRSAISVADLVTLTYFERTVVEVRAADGTVLQTEQQPERSGPLTLLMGIFFFSAGAGWLLVERAPLRAGPGRRRLVGLCWWSAGLSLAALLPLSLWGPRLWLLLTPHALLLVVLAAQHVAWRRSPHGARELDAASPSKFG